MNQYWHKQDREKALFPDLLWSRPQNRYHAGKLLVIGGNKYGFSAPAEAYAEAVSAGIGVTRVLLPLSIKKVAGALLPGLEYAASNPSGSFSKQALAEFLEQAVWADCVLFAGELGHNSETAILIESFLNKYSGRVCLTQDAVEYCLAQPNLVLKRPETLLVLTMAQLQKLAVNAKFKVVFKIGIDLIHLVDGLHEFTTQHNAMIIVKHLDQMVVAVNGQVSTTNLKESLETWRIKIAAQTSVWWLQNPVKPFESITTSVYQ